MAKSQYFQQTLFLGVYPFTTKEELRITTLDTES